MRWCARCGGSVRIQDLLSPAHDPADAFAVFSDLQVLSAIVQATWPATATVTPERGLAQALDAHITEQRQLQFEPMPRTRRSNQWVTPPRSAPATAGLLDIASRLLQLPPPSTLSLAIEALADRIPLPTTTGWGKTWTLLRRDCSSAFRTQMTEALPRTFHPAGASPITAWRRARQPVLPARRRDYLPEHIPQWLPDNWFTAAGLNASQPFLGRSVIFRRLQLGRHAAQLTPPVNYRSRRLRFSDWTLSLEDWRELQAALRRSRRNRPRLPDALIHTCASNMIWTQLTGSEWRLAPSVLVYYPGTEPTDFEPQQVQTIRCRLSRPQTRHGYYQDLREALLRHVHALSADSAEERFG